MTALATLFIHPIQLPGQMFWAVIPVCVAVAIVYRTIRIHSLQGLPVAIIKLSLQIILSVAALMLAGWAFINWVY